MRSAGRQSSDYVGISSENACEKQARRKSKVSWGRLIRPGLVDPKLRPYGVSDGHAVNIRQLTKGCLRLASDAVGTVRPSVGCLGSGVRERIRGP